jgi:hypothetical protein
MPTTTLRSGAPERRGAGLPDRAAGLRRLPFFPIAHMMCAQARARGLRRRLLRLVVFHRAIG